MRSCETTRISARSSSKFAEFGEQLLHGRFYRGKPRVRIGNIQVVYPPIANSLRPVGEAYPHQRSMLHLVDRDDEPGKSKVFFLQISRRPHRLGRLYPPQTQSRQSMRRYAAYVLYARLQTAAFGPPHQFPLTGQGVEIMFGKSTAVIVAGTEKENSGSHCVRAMTAAAVCEV